MRFPDMTSKRGISAPNCAETKVKDLLPTIRRPKGISVGFTVGCVGDIVVGLWLGIPSGRFSTPRRTFGLPIR